MDIQELEHRLERLEAKSAIQDLAVTYFLASDDDDFDRLATTFAPDATFAGNGFQSCHSREEIIESFREARSHMGVTIHTPHYALIEFDGPDRASGVVGAHLELAIGEDTVFCAARYLDQYVKIDGRWLFAARELRFIHVGSWDEAATSLTAEKRIRWPGAEPMLADIP
jgi:uncharacterized protein (TIGR02246 family)